MSTHPLKPSTRVRRRVASAVGDPELERAIACFAPQVSERSLSELVPSARNARTHSKKQIHLIAESIKAFGFVSPILATTDGEIVAGHGRYEAAKLLGMKKVQVIYINHLGPQQIRALRIADIMRTSRDGRGAINVLAADKLMMNPRLYATFLLWLMSELFEELPEVGDPDRPRLVFFFDEAHLLFDGAPKALVERVEQVVRLIRSKGVGVYFVTQNPLDVPETVLAQLGNRVQHALRAYTPREQKAVKTAADTFRPNPDFDCARTITQLGTGEALVSTLEAKGIPSMVQRTLIRPPSSRLGPITPEERRKVMLESPVAGQYDEMIDRESAFEMLQKKAASTVPAEQESGGSRWTIPGFGNDDAPVQTGRRTSAPRPSNRQSVTEAAVKSVVRSVGSSLGRAIVRGILGSLSKGR